MNKTISLLPASALTVLFATVAVADDPAVASAPVTITVGKAAPYVDESLIAKNVIEECGLPEAQMRVLREESVEAGVTLVENDEAVASRTGRVLVLETTNAVSSGNAFIGHHKQVGVRGKLFDNGAEVASFTAVRNSMGGFGAGFKSSCAVLYRCQGALARDVLGWLKNPVSGARLGDQ